MPRGKRAQKQVQPARQPPPWATALVLYGIIPVVIAALMALYLLAAKKALQTAGGQAAGEIGFPLDDSWIHARFAENLAHGRGFSFNPGEPTSTTTAASWTLLYAGAYRLTHEFFFTSFALNWLLCALLCVVVYHLTLTLHPSRWVALLAAVTVAVTVPLPWWALSGMEPPLYALLSVLGILLHVRLRDARGLRALLPTLVFGLAGLARPECLLLFPLAMADRLVMARRERRPGWLAGYLKMLAEHAPLFVVIVAPLFIYNYHVTGYWLPSSFYSKLAHVERLSVASALASGDSSQFAWAVFVAPVLEVWDLLNVWATNNATLLIVFLVGLALVTRAALRGESKGRSLLVPLVLVGQPVIWAWVGGYREPGFQSQRYIANLNPLYLAIAVIGAAWTVEPKDQPRSRYIQVAVLAAYLLAVLDVVWRGPTGENFTAYLTHGPEEVGFWPVFLTGITVLGGAVASGAFVVARTRWLSAATVRGALVGVVLMASLMHQPGTARTYTQNVKNITEMQVKIARWLRDNAPKGSLLAVNDVGAIGVITGDPVLDLQGLVTAEALVPRARSYQQRAAEQPPLAVFEFVASRRPDYVVVFPAWYPEYGAMGDVFTEVYRIELEDNITCGAPVMVVYKTDWPVFDRLRQERLR